MAELDPLWTEVHDLEQRVGRVEDELLRRAAKVEAVDEDRQRRRELLVRGIPIAVSIVSTALFVISRLNL